MSSARALRLVFALSLGLVGSAAIVLTPNNFVQLAGVASIFFAGFLLRNEI